MSNTSDTSDPSALLRELGAIKPPAELWQAGILSAAAHLRRGSFSALELLHACQARIDRVNGGQPSFYGAPDAINAWVRLYPELAERQAREADRTLAREGQRAPLLCGIPIGLKDLYAVAGLPLTASSRVLEGNIPSTDATAWARLRAAGMVLVGHLHTHEFAAGGTCDQVGNPWGLDLTPGGSSGGSGAALAANMVPAATGTDTAGSIRAPCAVCGVSGIKPTTGAIPLDGIIPLSPTFDTPGPMARSVADCSALLAAMCDGTARSVAHAVPAAPLGPLPITARSGSRPLEGCTVALTDRCAELALDDDVEAGLQRAQQAIQRLGGRLVELHAPMPAFSLRSPEFRIGGAERWAYHQVFIDRADCYRPSVREMIIRGRDAFTAAEYAGAQLRRAECARAWDAWMDENRVDLILEPTVRVVAYPRGDGHSYTDRNDLADMTVGWNVTGHPVVCLPAQLGPRSGLPTSISLIPRRGRDACAIQVAIDLQARELPSLRPALP